MNRFLAPLSRRTFLMVLALIVLIGTAGSVGASQWLSSAHTPTVTNAGKPTPAPSHLPATRTPEATPSVQGSSIPAAQPTPRLTPTPVPPQPVPTLHPTPASQLLGYDTFLRTLPQFWGRATDGQRWQGDANSNPNFEVKEQAGSIEGTGDWNALLGPATTDEMVLVTGSLEDFSGGTNNFGPVVRWTDASHWYKAYLDGSSLVLLTQNGSQRSVLCQMPFLALPQVSYTLRLQVRGTHLLARTWPSLLPEPAFWQINTEDQSLPTGHTGLRFHLSDSNTEATITHFEAQRL